MLSEAVEEHQEDVLQVGGVYVSFTELVQAVPEQKEVMKMMFDVRNASPEMRNLPFASSVRCSMSRSQRGPSHVVAD